MNTPRLSTRHLDRIPFLQQLHQVLSNQQPLLFLQQLQEQAHNNHLHKSKDPGYDHHHNQHHHFTPTDTANN